MHTSTVLKQPRRVERLVTGQPTSDGAGVKLTRVLTQDLQQRLDPFLLLDNFGSNDPKDWGAGFTLQRFHKAMLDLGSPPIGLLSTALDRG